MDSGKNSSVEDLIDLPGARELAHRTYERAAQQFTKLLGTVYGGLGVILIAWLQRLFEAAADHALRALVWCLAGALGLVALGLVSLVLAAFIDQRSSYHLTLSISLNIQRFLLAKRHAQIKLLNLQGDEKSAEESYCADANAELIPKIVQADTRARQLNTISERVGIGSWICVIVTFATLAVGIVNTISHFGVVR